MAPKTVTLFLMDGTPSGRIKCSLTNWIGQVYLLPRTALTISKERKDLHQTGVYLLLGTDDQTGEDLVYVGQARERKNGKGVLGRILEHVGEEKLDYFTHAIAIVTSNNSFGPTEISYLENVFYQQLLAAGRAKTTNGNDPSPGTVVEEKQAELDEFFNFAKIAIGSLGYRFFNAADETKRIPNPSEQDITPGPGPTLFLKDREAEGAGRQTTDGFVLLKGSKIRPLLSNKAPANCRKNRRRYQHLINSDNELTDDALFTSPSAASSFLIGYSTNGKLHWKDQAGTSLGDLERRELLDDDPPNQQPSELAD